jgi:hypothetical protein
MTHSARWLLIPLACATFACADGNSAKSEDTDTTNAAPTPVGLWEVRKQTINQTGCTSQGDEVIPIPFIDLRMNGAVLEFYTCTAEDTCAPTPDTERSFELVDEEWIGVSLSGSVSEQEQACRMFRQERYLTLDEDQITIEIQDLVKYEPGIVDEDDCDEEAADWKGGGGECAPYEVIKADRVATGGDGA